MALACRTCIRVAIATALFLHPLPSSGQCSAPSRPSDVQDFFTHQDWPSVVRWVQSRPHPTADDNFAAGLALAHLQRWDEARSAFRAGERQCPKQARFPVELAGIAFQQKNYPRAEREVRRGLRLNPADQYALDLAGTTYLLDGNLDAALKYWNLIQRPHIDEIHFDPQIRLRRSLLDRSFAFAPHSLLKRDQYLSTLLRLNGLGIFPVANISIVSRPGGSFDAEFHAFERNGFGSGPLQTAIAVLSGVPYQTIYVDYSNLHRSAVNVDSLFRWDAQKRRAWVDLSSPLRNLAQWRWSLTGDARNENWAIRRSFTGTAPVLAGLNLQTVSASAALTSFQSAHLQWSIGGNASYRKFRDVTAGSALTPGLLAHGVQLKQTDTISSTVLDLPEHHVTVTAGGSFEVGRLWSPPSHAFAKLGGSAQASWRPSAAHGRYDLSQSLRAGRVFGKIPFDELYMLGMERDNDLWLRGLIGDRDGRKGSSPLGTKFVLSNSDVYARIYDGGFFSIHAGPLFDAGRAGAPSSDLSSGKWIFAAGAQAKLTVFGTSVVFTYGRNLSQHQNAFFANVAH